MVTTWTISLLSCKVRPYLSDNSHLCFLLLGNSQSVSGTANLPLQTVLITGFCCWEAHKGYKPDGDYVLIPVMATMWLETLAGFALYVCELLPCIYTCTAGSFDVV